jgi:hypothetical protein
VAVTFNQRYWSIVLPLWLVASTGLALIAAVASPTWQDVVAFAFGWGIFTVALWWTLDAVRTHRAGERAQSPGTILDERLAKGEISADDYQRLKEVMGQRNEVH